MTKSKLIRIILFSAIVYCVLFGYYILVSQGLGNKPFYLQMRRFIPLSLILTTTIMFLRSRVPLSFFISFTITSLSWALVYPIIHKITYVTTQPFFSYHFDIIFAVYTFIGFSYLAYMLNNFVNSTLNSIITSTIQTIMLLIPIIEIAYFSQYNTCISEHAIMALFQTNSSEALEYIIQNFSWQGILGTLILFGSIYYYLFKINKHSFDKISQTPYKKAAILILATIIICTLSYSFTKPFLRTGIIELVINVNNYFNAINKFRYFHDNNFNNLEVLAPLKTFPKPSTFILIIGESASRSYMSAYSNTERNTTPWLKTQANNNNFLIFHNAYSSWGQTVPSLERALTEKNQYVDKDFNRSITIIDIAKKAGYHTYWFSNQGTIDVADTPITLVGKTADVAKWTNEDFSTVQYDESLLNLLKEVNPSRNNFIVLHLMGSHDNFQNRYPSKFSIWGNPKINEPILNYDNSLYYTDWLLSKTFEYATQNLNLQAMIYFSDHGTNPNHKRHPDEFGFVSLRIPLFVYLSDEYASTFPVTAQTLKSNILKYWTNDLTYDLICGILNIQSPNFDETQSIASPKYKFTKETLRTKLGKVPLTSDTDE